MASDKDDDAKDAKRWRYICDCDQLPMEFAMLMSMGADRSEINKVIDSAMRGNHIETLN